MQRLKTITLFACAMLMGYIGSRAAAVASAHGGDATQIHACVNPGNGTIYMVAPDEACGPNQVALDWSIQGPAGPSGVLGFYDVEQDLGFISKGGGVSYSAACNAGDYVTGGGYWLDQNYPGASVTQSRPNGQAWLVAFYNDVNSAGAVHVKVYARCADVTP